MASNKTENEKIAPIIIKRVKKVAGGHHGGAWKVAYADFVTAMMAFFLLLWLLNVTTDEQKNAISNYFDPTSPLVSSTTSGAGGILAGLSASVDGAMVSNVQPISQPPSQAVTRGTMDSKDMPGEAQEGLDMDGGFYNTLEMNEKQLEAEFRKLEDARFETAAETLRQEIAESEELKALAEHVLVDVTPEGLRIQIIDDKGRTMFASGSAVMHGFMRELLLKVSKVIGPMSNQISVRGHTDSVRYREPNRYDNWNLSADRAQNSRRVLVEGGVGREKIENVMGRADRDPLLADDPSNERNRRISVVLLREARPESQAKAQTPPATQAPQTRANAGLRIVDDTQSQSGQTATQNAQRTSQGGNAGAANTQQPAPALPVQPGGNTRQPNPQTQTFGAEQGQGGSQVIVLPNKPPTITTPVFGNRRKREEAPIQGEIRNVQPNSNERSPVNQGDTSQQGEHKFLSF